jgi:hypothetical protein
LRSGTAVIALLLVACTSTPVPQPTPNASSNAVSESESASAAPGETPPQNVVAIAPVTACDLLFKDEATAALGVTIEDTQSTSSLTDEQGWDNDCLFRRHPYGDIAPLLLTLSSGQRYSDAFESLKLEEGVAPRAGIGDAALVRSSTIWGLPGQVVALYVESGGAVMELSLGVADLAADGSPVLVGSAEEQEQALVELATIATDRLTTPAGPTAETCQLLSLDEAVAMVGVPMGSAEDVDYHDAWGPACRYNGTDGNAELYVAVDTRPGAVEHFDECKTNGEAILGVGEQAFYASGCPIQIEFDVIGNSLLARSGTTVVTIGEGGQLEFEPGRALLVDVGRLVLQRLGQDPGAAPQPVASGALLHPCTLASNAEVAAAVGVEIANQSETAAVEDLNAMCYYRTADEDQPLRLNLGTGQDAVRMFGYYADNPVYQAVEGVGDEAYSTEIAVESDQPLVTLSVRRGETVLELQLGGNGYSADTFKLIAPGTPEEQLALLRGLAELILPRVFGGS